MQLREKFNPMCFLASLGAGGLSVSFFMYLMLARIIIYKYIVEKSIKTVLLKLSSTVNLKEI